MVSVEHVLKKEYPKIFQYPKLISKCIVKVSQWIVHENSINQFIVINDQKSGLAFIDTALGTFKCIVQNK
jgi:hypothetical protein